MKRTKYTYQLQNSIPASTYKGFYNSHFLRPCTWQLDLTVYWMKKIITGNKQGQCPYNLSFMTGWKHIITNKPAQNTYSYQSCLRLSHSSHMPISLSEIQPDNSIVRHCPWLTLTLSVFSKCHVLSVVRIEGCFEPPRPGTVINAS